MTIGQDSTCKQGKALPFDTVFMLRTRLFDGGSNVPAQSRSLFRLHGPRARCIAVAGDLAIPLRTMRKMDGYRFHDIFHLTLARLPQLSADFDDFSH